VPSKRRSRTTPPLLSTCRIVVFTNPRMWCYKRMNNIYSRADGSRPHIFTVVCCSAQQLIEDHGVVEEKEELDALSAAAGIFDL